jgi:hypothetical protein
LLVPISWLPPSRRRQPNRPFYLRYRKILGVVKTVDAALRRDHGVCARKVLDDEKAGRVFDVERMAPKPGPFFRALQFGNAEGDLSSTKTPAWHWATLEGFRSFDGLIINQIGDET